MSSSCPLTVVMPVHNSMPYLDASLASVYHQTLGHAHLELVAVDDGSSDGSTECLQRWADRWPTMRIARHSTARGPSHARNVGLALATGAFVFFHDSDDALGPRALERLLRAGTKAGSDIVLGKVVGVGRRVDQAAFTHDADYATLTAQLCESLLPVKLFRRSFLQANGLTFPEHHWLREDQHFVVASYLRARSISVVATYDCYYALRRPTGDSLTDAPLDLLTVLRQLPETLDLVDSSHGVEPAVRELLLARLLRKDVAELLTARWLRWTPQERQSFRDPARRVVARWSNGAVLDRVPLPERAVLLALRDGDDAHITATVRWAHGPLAPLRRRDARWWVPVPGPQPGGAHDCGDQSLAVDADPEPVTHLDGWDLSAAGLTVRGHALLRGVPSADTTVRIRARPWPHSPGRHPLDGTVTPTPSPHVTIIEGRGLVDHVDAGFTARIGFGEAEQATRTRGSWQVVVELTHADYRVTTPLGRSVAADVLPDATASQRRTDGRTRTIEMALRRRQGMLLTVGPWVTSATDDVTDANVRTDGVEERSLSAAAARPRRRPGRWGRLKVPQHE